MPIPSYQDLYKDFLTSICDGGIYSMNQVRDLLSAKLSVSEEERTTLLPSGKQRIWNSRVGWSKTYLAKAGLVVQPQRGFVQISSRGLDVLAEQPTLIDDKYLCRFDEFRDFVSPGGSGDYDLELTIKATSTGISPEEQLESSYLQVRQALQSELLDRIMTCSPEFFEQLVIDLLLKMGYGGSPSDAAKVGRSGDGGIDGIIKEDKLGLNTLYLQAKRWANSVGRPEVQRFAGALHGQRAKKGILITTSTFTKEAESYANNIETKIVLIDGRKLTEFMFDYGLGCSSQSIFELKKIDSDYFDLDSAK